MAIIVIAEKSKSRLAASLRRARCNALAGGSPL